MGFIQRLGQLRSPVSTYSNLPLSGNVIGDVRLSTDTGDAYTWMIESSSGSLTDWKKVTSSSFNDLVDAPTSTGLAIDDAVKVVTGLSINIALLAFQTLTGYGAAVARMFDGIVNQFTYDETGLELDNCENQIWFDPYYMPNKSDLDINTKLLIHGDGVQGSTSFIDLLRSTITSHGAITDTSIKKYGTGSIKFDGINDYVDLNSIGMFSGIYNHKFTVDFWYYSSTSGIQPILESHNTVSGLANNVIRIYKDAANKIVASFIVGGGYGEGGTSVSVTSTSSILNSTWTHVAIQSNGDGDLTVWINGILEDTELAVITSDLYIEADPYSLFLGKRDSIYLNGQLDEIRFSNIDRYSSSPFTLMTKAYNTSLSPVPSYDVTDYSSSNHVVTAYGNARLSGNNLSFGNASLYLDGINSYLSLADSDDWILTEDLGVGEIDSYTKLLLHLDNNVTDSETSPKTVTNNNVTFSSSTKKFGTHSAVFNGSSSYLSIPDSDDFNFGSNPFVIEGWFNFNSFRTSYNYLFSHYQSDNDFMRFFVETSGTRVEFDFFSGGTQIINLDSGVSSLSLQTGQWYHFAVIRGWNGNVNDWAITINGIAVATKTDSDAAPNYSGSFVIGSLLPYPTITGFDGYVDEVRISKGVARWTSNFTPSSSEYGAVNFSDYTIDLWIDPLSLSDANAFIIGQDDSWKLTLDGTSNKYLKYTIIGGASLIAPISLNLETWQHVAIVQKDGAIKIYVNGVLGASCAGTIIDNGVNNLTIGADSNGEYLFNGYIEEIRISKGVARWTSSFTPPTEAYDEENPDSYTKLLMPLNVIVVPNMVLQSTGYVSNYVPTSARVVIFEEDIDTMESNVDLIIEVSRDGGTTFTPCTIAKDTEFGDGTLNLFTGSVDLTSQPSGELMVWKLTTQNNKDCRIRGISMNWR